MGDVIFICPDADFPEQINMENAGEWPSHVVLKGRSKDRSLLCCVIFKNGRFAGYTYDAFDDSMFLEGVSDGVVPMDFDNLTSLTNAIWGNIDMEMMSIIHCPPDSFPTMKREKKK